MKAKWSVQLLPWYGFVINAAVGTRFGFPDMGVRVMIVIGTLTVSAALLVMSQPWKLTKSELEDAR